MAGRLWCVRSAWLGGRGCGVKPKDVIPCKAEHRHHMKCPECAPEERCCPVCTIGWPEGGPTDRPPMPTSPHNKAAIMSCRASVWCPDWPE